MESRYSWQRKGISLMTVLVLSLVLAVPLGFTMASSCKSEASTVLFAPFGQTQTDKILSASPWEDACVTNGNVRAIATSGDTTYLGGQFTYLGRYTGTGVPLNASSGVPLPSFPKIEGWVWRSVPDGSGGWYVGGNFTKIDGVTKERLAHILSDGSLDPSWNTTANNVVYALTLSNGVLYVGGDFTSIGGQSRNRIAALDASTGEVITSWNPNANDRVHALAVSSGLIYVGGFFSNMDGQSRSCLAAIDIVPSSPDYGKATSWNPGANSTVWTLAVSGGTIYAGGHFWIIGGQTRNYIAAIDASGNVTSWNPNAGGAVRTLVISGGTVYAGGWFTSIGGLSRSRVAALDASTGQEIGRAHV